MVDFFNFDTKEVSKTVKNMAEIMGCDYKTAWDQYTHELIKESVKWEDVEAELTKI